MNRTFFLSIAVLLYFACRAMGADNPPFEAALRSAGVTNQEIPKAVSSSLWNPEKSAAAVSIHRPSGSLVLLLLRQPDGHFRAIDLSAVEDGNFGKLGSRRITYDKFETEPVEWMARDDGMFQVSIRTRAWRSGQRYTVYEPQIVRPDGTPLWR